MPATARRLSPPTARTTPGRRCIHQDQAAAGGLRDLGGSASTTQFTDAIVREIATHKAMPLGTVKSWVRRALITLRGCLERGALRDMEA